MLRSIILLEKNPQYRKDSKGWLCIISVATIHRTNSIYSVLNALPICYKLPKVYDDTHRLSAIDIEMHRLSAFHCRTWERFR